jgi:hypothetical protein
MWADTSDATGGSGGCDGTPRNISSGISGEPNLFQQSF